MTKALSIKKVFTTIYNPSGDGVAERINRTLLAALSKLCVDVVDWDAQLPIACLAHNSTVSAATDLSPFLLMTGRDPPTLVALGSVPTTPAQALQEMSARLTTANQQAMSRIRHKEKVIQEGNKQHGQASRFSKGDIVMMYADVVPGGPGGAKLFRRYNRRFEVMAVRLPNTAVVREWPGDARSEHVTAHYKKLKLAPPHEQTEARALRERMRAGNPVPVVRIAPAPIDRMQAPAVSPMVQPVRSILKPANSSVVTPTSAVAKEAIPKEATTTQRLSVQPKPVVSRAGRVIRPPHH
jgi:hypothetical protein